LLAEFIGLGVFRDSAESCKRVGVASIWSISWRWHTLLLHCLDCTR